FGEMREMGVRGVLVYCADYHCSHGMAMNADRWPDDVRLSDIEPGFVCAACGRRGADVRPDFNWKRSPSLRWDIETPEIRRQHVTQITVGKCRFGHDQFRVLVRHPSHLAPSLLAAPVE